MFNLLFNLINENITLTHLKNSLQGLRTDEMGVCSPWNHKCTNKRTNFSLLFLQKKRKAFFHTRQTATGLVS